MKVIVTITVFTVFNINIFAQFGGITTKIKSKVEGKVKEKVEKVIDDIENNKKNQESKTDTTSIKSTKNNKTNTMTNESSDHPQKNYDQIETNSSIRNNNQANILFHFSNTSFSNPKNEIKTSFSSNEFIYGKFVLSESIKSFFKINEPKDKEKYYINYVVHVFDKDGEELGAPNPIWNYCYLSNTDVNQNTLLFDILPEPSKASTVISPLDDFSAGKGSTPLYMSIGPVQFPSTGKYKIKVEFYRKIVNAYGIEKPREEWPMCSAQIEFNFDENDVEKLQKNANDANTHIKDNFYKKETEETALPDAWSMTSQPITSGYSEQQVRNMIKAWDSKAVVKKLVVWTAKRGWIVEKNDLDIPLSKFYDQTISFFMTDSENNCFYVEGVINQTYHGGGGYGDPWFYYTLKKQFSCSKMK